MVSLCSSKTREELEDELQQVKQMLREAAEVGRDLVQKNAELRKSACSARSSRHTSRVNTMGVMSTMNRHSTVTSSYSDVSDCSRDPSADLSAEPTGRRTRLSKFLHRDESPECDDGMRDLVDANEELQSRVDELEQANQNLRLTLTSKEMTDQMAEFRESEEKGKDEDNSQRHAPKETTKGTSDRGQATWSDKWRMGLVAQMAKQKFEECKEDVMAQSYEEKRHLQEMIKHLEATHAETAHALEHALEELEAANAKNSQYENELDNATSVLEMRDAEYGFLKAHAAKLQEEVEVLQMSVSNAKMGLGDVMGNKASMAMSRCVTNNLQQQWWGREESAASDEEDCAEQAPGALDELVAARRELSDARRALWQAKRETREEREEKERLSKELLSARNQESLAEFCQSSGGDKPDPNEANPEETTKAVASAAGGSSSPIDTRISSRMSSRISERSRKMEAIILAAAQDLLEKKDLDEPASVERRIQQLKRAFALVRARQLHLKDMESELSTMRLKLKAYERKKHEDDLAREQSCIFGRLTNAAFCFRPNSIRG